MESRECCEGRGEGARGVREPGDGDTKGARRGDVVVIAESCDRAMRGRSATSDGEAR